MERALLESLPLQVRQLMNQDLQGIPQPFDGVDMDKDSDMNQAMGGWFQSLGF